MDKFIAQKAEKLSKAVGSVLPTVSFQYLQKLLRKKDVKVNDKRVSSDVQLAIGDQVTLYTDDKKMFRFEPRTLFEDDNLMVVIKPKNMPSVEANSLEEHLRRTTNNPALIVAHRLDTNTEGIQLVAKSEDVFEALKRAFRAGEIEKRYVCVAVGFLTGKSTLKAYIKKSADESRVYVYDKPVDGALSAITEYKVLDTYDGATKLEINLKTGRTHQIRAHLQHIDHPIIGDSKYGDYKINEKYREKTQALKAYFIKINIKSGILAYLEGETFVIDTDLDIEKKLIKL